MFEYENPDEELSSVVSIFAPLESEQNVYTFGDPSLLDCELQMAPDNCAVEAERAIINIFTDAHLTQQEAMDESSSHGWYQPGCGTMPDDVGRMMDLYGIPNHTVIGASMRDLLGELAMGHGIIVPVDSKELMDNGPMSDLRLWMSNNFGVDYGDPTANHAVIVSGIDVTDPCNPMVIINDSGVPNGKGCAYPMDKFLQAWEDSDCRYTATDVSLPSSSIHGSRDNMFTAFENISHKFDMGDIVSSVFGCFAGVYTAAEILDNTGDVTAAITNGIAKTIEVTKTSELMLDELFNNDDFVASL